MTRIQKIKTSVKRFFYLFMKVFLLLLYQLINNLEFD